MLLLVATVEFTKIVTDHCATMAKVAELLVTGAVSSLESSLQLGQVTQLQLEHWRNVSLDVSP